MRHVPQYTSADINHLHHFVFVLLYFWYWLVGWYFLPLAMIGCVLMSSFINTAKRCWTWTHGKGQDKCTTVHDCTPFNLSLSTDICFVKCAENHVTCLCNSSYWAWKWRQNIVNIIIPLQVTSVARDWQRSKAFPEPYRVKIMWKSARWRTTMYGQDFAIVFKKTIVKPTRKLSFQKNSCLLHNVRVCPGRQCLSFLCGVWWRIVTWEGLLWKIKQSIYC